MKLLWGLICNRVITDANSNTVSYIDCLEEIQAAGLPTILHSAAIASLWEKTAPENEKFKVRVNAVSPLGESKKIIETQEIDMIKDRHRLNFVINGFPLKEEGRYNFKVDMFSEGKWSPAFEVSFKVIIDKTVFENKTAHR